MNEDSDFIQSPEACWLTVRAYIERVVATLPPEVDVDDPDLFDASVDE